jgi:hypothetical protein
VDSEKSILFRPFAAELKSDKSSFGGQNEKKEKDGRAAKLRAWKNMSE